MDKFGVGILYDYMVLLFVLEHPFVQMMHLRVGISAVLIVVLETHIILIMGVRCILWMYNGKYLREWRV